MHAFYEFWCQLRDALFLTLYEGTPFYLEICFHNKTWAIESTIDFIHEESLR